MTPQSNGLKTKHDPVLEMLRALLWATGSTVSGHCVALSFPATPQAARACLGPAMTSHHFAEHGNPTQSQVLVSTVPQSTSVCVCLYVQRERQVCKKIKYLLNVSVAISEKS